MRPLEELHVLYKQPYMLLQERDLGRGYKKIGVAELVGVI